MSAKHGVRVVRAHVPSLIAAIVLALAAPGSRVGAAPGSLDPGFGNGGRVVTAVSPGGDGFQAIALQPDGKIVAVGDSAGTAAVPSADFALVRYNTDGTRDASFGSNGIVGTDLEIGRATPGDVAIQPDGRILVAAAGLASAGAGYTHAVLFRYNADGSTDSTFGVNGVALTESPQRGAALALQPDGAIVLAGTSAWADDTFYDFALARFTADGVLDESFGDGGHVRTAFPGYIEILTDVALQDDGRIVALGYNGDFLLARYLPDGSLDPTFGTGGTVVMDIHNDSGTSGNVAIQADGKIVAMGYATRYETSLDFYAARFRTDGSLDPAFDGDGKVATDFAGSSDYGYAMTIDGIGRIILAGMAYQSTGHSDFALLRYNADGSLDTSFGSGGRQTTNFSTDENANAVLVQPDGKIVAAGRAWSGSTTNSALARYDGGIPHASAFFPHAVDEPPVSGALTMKPAPPSAQALTVSASSVTWLSAPAVNGLFPAGAEFRFITPCTRTSSLGKTVRLASTDLNGANEQLLGTAQSASTCGRTETIVVPVTTPVTLTNRRLKLTVTAASGGLHLQLGARTFVSATAFEGAEQ